MTNVKSKVKTVIKSIDWCVVMIKLSKYLVSYENRIIERDAIKEANV